MKKKEFVRAWSEIRSRKIDELYKGDPHGVACSIMSKLEIPKDAERLWRKNRKHLTPMSVPEFLLWIKAEVEPAQPKPRDTKP